MRGWGAPLIAGSAVFAACASHAPSAPPPPAFTQGAFYATLESDADGFSIDHGDWLEDFGDAPFYGLAFYAHASREEKNDAWAARAEAARQRALSLTTNADLVNGDLQEMVMSTLGLIDAMDARGDRADIAVVDEFLDRIDELVKLVGWYIEVGADRSWALATYGPTSISALIGLANLQYAYLLGGDRKDDRIAWAKEMAQHIDEHAWNGAAYTFGLGRPGVLLYPNVAMMAMQARLFQVTGDGAYKDRARAIYDAVQPLKLPTSPTRYYSEYSAADMGAKTRDYSTLSEHNYLVLSLMLLYQITGDRAFVDEADSVLDAFATEVHGRWCLSDLHHETCAPGCATSTLCVGTACESDRCQNAVLHHWIDGRPAQPSDPSFMCSGCNMQML
jgi:hypothetical protein